MQTFVLENIKTVEFGVCVQDGAEQRHCLVPSDKEVQDILVKMVQATFDHWTKCADQPDQYNPAQKYETVERLQASLNDTNIAPLKLIYESINLPKIVNAMNDLANINYYFTLINFKNAKKLLAIRRASYFMGLAKNRNRLVRMLDDTLTIIRDTVFKFDLDFDFFVLGDQVIILRPKAFEAIACLDDVLKEKAKVNIEILQKSLKFVDLSSFANFVETHKRAARLVASVLSRDDLKKTSKSLLHKDCKLKGVYLRTVNGKLRPEPGHEEAFLMVLDRRRFSVNLITDELEIYDADHRKKTN